MTDPEIDALAEEACPCMTDPDDPPSTKCMTPEYQQHWPECHASNRQAVAAAIKKALAANDAEWRGRIESKADALRVESTAIDCEGRMTYAADDRREGFQAGLAALRQTLLEGR